MSHMLTFYPLCVFERNDKQVTVDQKKNHNKQFLFTPAGIICPKRKKNGEKPPSPSKNTDVYLKVAASLV